MPAATVESAFVLIDRASGPVRKIRRELRGLEKDARKAGEAIDDVSGPRQVQQMEQLARETERTSTRMRRETGGMAREVQSLERRTDSARRATRSFGHELRTVGNTLRSVSAIMGLLKWPVLIAGAGGAAQALGGLVGGATALLPALTDLAGPLASGGTLLVGYGAAAGVAKLALSDLDKALGGNKEALKSLTPEGRAFLQVLREMQPQVTRMRREAQQGLFPGLTDLLGDLRSQAPQVRAIIRQTSGDLGGLARFGGQQVRAPGFMRDLRELSDQGGRALGAATRSLFGFARAAEHTMIAAGPLTDWLGTTVEGWSQTAENQARVARETGRLDRYFTRVRGNLQRFGRISENVWGGMSGLMGAARRQGDSLWDSIERGTERWDEWANSFQGQSEMRRWFDDVRPSLDATVGLVGDLTQMVGRLAQGPEGARMLESLRDAVPDIERGIGGLTQHLGPAAVDALGQVVGLLGTLASSSGPLTLVASAIGETAEAVNDLLQLLGPLGPAVATLGTSALLLRRAGLGGGGGGALGMLGLGAAAGAGTARGRGGGNAGLLAAGSGVAAGAGAGALSRTMASLRGNYALARTGGFVVDSTGAASRVAAAGRVGAARGALGSGALTGATSAAGRFLLPLLAISGGLGAIGTEGNLLDKAQGGVSAVSMGIVPRPISDSEREGAAGSFAAKIIEGLSTDGGLGAQRKTVRSLRGQIGRLPGNDALDQNKADLSAATELLKKELERRQGLLKESERAHRDNLAAQSIANADGMVRDFTAAFDIRAKGSGPVAAMRRTVSAVLDEQRKLNPAGRRVLGESMLAWAREQARMNPALEGEYERLVKGIERRFSRMGRHVRVVNGQILTGSQSEWRAIRTAMTTQTEIARQEVMDDFTAMQNQAVGALRAMGYSDAEAKSLVAMQERGSAPGASASDKLTGKRAAGAATRGGALAPAYKPSVGDRTGDAWGADSAGTMAAPTRAAAAANLMGAKSGLASYASDAAGYGLRVSSGARPGAITNAGNRSYHASGDALDLAGSPADMMRFALHAASAYGSQLEELIYSPMGFSIKNGQRVAPYAVADHYDHVHLADTAPSGLAGGAAGGGMPGLSPGLGGKIQIDGSQSALGGLPGAMSSAASGMYAAGLTDKLNAMLGAGGSFGADMPGMSGGIPTSGTLSQQQIAALAAQVGFPNPNLVAAIAMAESGGRVGVINSIGATGLMQILQSAHPQYDPARLASDPLYNLRAAYAISSGGTNWGPWEAFTRGMHTRYMGDGIGHVMARPRLSGGVARIRRTGDGIGRSGGAGGVQIANHVQVNAGGRDPKQVEAIVDRRLEQFVAAVEADILGGQEEDPEGAMG